MKAHLKAGAVVLSIVAAGFGLWHFLLRPTSQTESVRRSVETLPSMRLTTIDRREIDTEAARGRVVIVNFWASWCAPCIEEVPSLIRLSETMGNDLWILAVSGDSSLDDIWIFLKSFPKFQREGIDIVFDEGLKLAKMFDVIRLPESYIFDSKGRMIRKVVGTIDWSNPEAIEYLKKLK